MDKKIAFIVSTNFCGSTMLGLILGSHSKCEFVGEFNKRQNLYANSENYAHAKKNGFCLFCAGTCPVMSKIKNYKDAFKMFPDKILIDTSKKIEWIKKNKIYKEYVIFLKRDTNKIIESYKKRDRFSSKLKTKIKKSMKTKQKTIRKFNSVKINYEDVCNSNGIEKCCKFIGIDYEPEMREFWEKQHHGYGNRSLIKNIVEGKVKEIRKA